MVARRPGACRLFDGLDWPNGIGFSPDGRTLYACDYHAGHVIAHAVDAAGDVSSRRVFWRSPSGDVDGLAVDERGGVWVALGRGGGVARVGPGGVLERVLDVPAGFVASCSFGGVDRRDLYIATQDNTDDPARGGTLFRVRVDVPGLPPPLATV